MLLSPIYDFKHQGKLAGIRVIRNDGNCWGEVKLADGQRFSVQTAFDWYEYPDEDAARGLAGAFKRGRGVEPSCLSFDPFY